MKKLVAILLVTVLVVSSVVVDARCEWQLVYPLSLVDTWRWWIDRIDCQRSDL